ncbi:MAG: hypothetical protein OXN96_20945 [Bryobacterales bacterium]|nr:hypothetical protein [Bryobacterales bacterium]
MKLFLRQVTSALRRLDPGEVRAQAQQPVTFGILAADESFVDEVQELLFPHPHPPNSARLLLVTQEADFARADVGFSESGVPHPAHFHVLDPWDPGKSIGALLDDDRNEDLLLALAANFPGLRRSVSERLIWRVCKENTLFAAATSLPNIVPSVLSLPWTIGEFASDTAFLTMNQVRLALLLAAAHGKPVGYDRQAMPIASILASAMGWRALARTAVSKLPAGGGLVSKGLVAFAGTFALGRALEYWFQHGRPLAKASEAEYYADALQRGRSTVERIVKNAVSLSRPAAGSA